MRTRLTVIWAALMAAAVTVAGVLTGRRRRRRAERQRAREERRRKRAQRKGQGGRKRAATTSRAAGVARSTSAPTPATSTAAVVRAPDAPVAETGSAPAESAERTESSGGDVGDDLQAIKGLGSVAATKLKEAGITRYAQIAAWTPEDVQEIATRLSLRPGRIASDDWVGQAQRLLKERGS